MKQTAMIVIGEPCIRCGKPIRADYEGFCMDCADTLNISELNNRGEPTKKELEIIKRYKEKSDVRTGRNHTRK